MKLTQTNIEQLYKFTRQHYVEHYDVQTELVDHLANDIEEIWVTQPHLSFIDARDKSFKKFGIFGFMDVIEAKQKQMSKRYTKIILRFVKEWYTVPQIIVTLSIFFLVYAVLNIQYSDYIILGILGSGLIYELIILSKIKKEQKKKEEKNEKIFLLEAMIGTTRNSYTGLVFVNLFNFVNITHVKFINLENHWLLLISFSVTFLIILFYVISYIIPEKAEELLQETYPEYKIVKNM